MLLSTIEQGLILGIMVLGVYITYRVLDFPDLSTDGTFPLGGAVVAALLMKGFSPYIAVIIAGLAGALAGCFTGILHTRLRITNLLSGILVMTGLYSINLRIMGKANIPLFNVPHLFGEQYSVYSNSIILIGIVGVLATLLILLFKTKFGFALRALGDNETLVTSLGVNEKNLKIGGLALGNFLTAISGAIYAQYQGFSDVGMGIGIVIIGLASIILGELVFGKIKYVSPLIMIIIGSFLYRVVIVLSLNAGLQASDLKILTALIIILIIFFKEKVSKIKVGR
ncbi:MAG: ABC transporter permease [Fusobacteriaceae bacterium]